MIDRQIRRRFLYATCFALLVAAVLVITARAAEDECEYADDYEACLISKYPDICPHLEPYSYWWYFLDCGNVEALASVTLTDEVTTDRRRLRLEREYLDGRRVVLMLDRPRRVR